MSWDEKGNLSVNRWQPWIDTATFEARDFTGATFKMQVRDTKDKSGDPRIDLGNATAGSEGISWVVTTTDGVPNSTLTFQIDKATIDAVPVTSPPGGDQVLYYDLHVTSGGIERRELEGTFTIRAGVTV